MVSLNLSNIKCKPKDDKTKCNVKSDDCSSSLIVSLKLPMSRLTTSNPMMSSLLTKSLSIQIMLGGDKGIMFITLVMKP